MTGLLWGASGVAALVYGLAFAGRRPSWPKTVIKVTATTLLAAIALWQGAPWQLTAGLALCALGDAFLAGDPKRWLPAGMAAFLLGHLLYILLFTQLREPGIEPSVLQTAGLAAVALAALAMLAFLWNHLGALRPAVILYVGAIAVMVGTGFLLDGWYWPAMVGAVAFMASDAVLAIALFRDEHLFGSKRASDWSIWFLYYGAQVGIAWPFVAGGY